MDTIDFNQGLLSFLQASPTSFHATAEMARQLDEAGFTALDERHSWTLEVDQQYYVIRHDSAIIAFTTGSGDLTKDGIRMVGAHTDSPALKVKPNPEINSQDYFQLGVEVYGGALLNPWFDRDLSMAGRVSWQNKNGQIQNTLVDFKKAVATIPSLAIHLDREANQKRSINSQKDIPPVLCRLHGGDKPDFRQMLARELEKQDLEPEQVLDYEIFFYDTQPPAVIGLDDEFIAAARLDNLLSCYAGMKAIIAAKNSPYPCLLVCNDHEEVGSSSTNGANGPFLRQVLDRLCDTPTELTRTLQNSMIISADNAHGIHPNFADKHDSNHGPLLNNGPVIKINANQRYATTSETSALFRTLCQQQNVPVQSFVARTDMGCGSTIGPITASSLGIRTLDIGLPTFGMHSIRELAGRDDAVALAKVLVYFFQQENLFA